MSNRTYTNPGENCQPWGDASEYEDTCPEAKPVRLERFVGVTAYTVGLANRAYGGPEEGGWWYDTFEPQRVFYIRNDNRGVWTAACLTRQDYVLQKLQRWCDRMNKHEGRRDTSSVLCDGYWTVERGACTRPQPEERPYYS